MNISIDAEKASIFCFRKKAETPLVIKTLSKPGRQENCLNLINNIYIHELNRIFKQNLKKITFTKNLQLPSNLRVRDWTLSSQDWKQDKDVLFTTPIQHYTRNLS